MNIDHLLRQAAAGAVSGEAVYVDDVFSTYLYTGNGSTQTITNGIDLDGEGGLTWFKARDDNTFHILFDTERGGTKWLNSASSNAESTASPAWIEFNTDGFNLTQGINGLNNTQEMASWTFRKQPGFFDVVTYSGNSSTQTISHNLGSVPGMIIIKRYDGGLRDWAVYHRSVGNGHRLTLNGTNEKTAFAGWNYTTPTDTEFYLGNDSDVNNSAGSYVAYLFAHDAQDFGTDSDESIIKCGSYDGSSSTQDIELGFEPQWLLIKGYEYGASGDDPWWIIVDTMREMTDSAVVRLFPNANNSDNTNTSNKFIPKPTGFQIQGSGRWENQSGYSYVYVAIRRPHKPAEEFAATELFALQDTTTSGEPLYNSSFPVDMGWYRQSTSSDAMNVGTRLLQGTKLETSNTNAESSSSQFMFDYSDGWNSNSNAYTDLIGYMFRRAPGFFDVVTYTGNSVSGDAKAHSLGVTPEMIIIKNRNNSNDWNVWHSSLSATQSLRLNLTNAVENNSWWITSPTNQYFYPSNYQGINQSGYNYIAYLFATVPGISKVGSYTGTGSDLDVNCGFTSGARMVWVKRTDSTGDWYLWDSERGIVAGNDPYLLLNSNSSQVTSTDYIDPLSSGFTITSTAPSALNASGGTYLFLAIA